MNQILLFIIILILVIIGIVTNQLYNTPVATKVNLPIKEVKTEIKTNASGTIIHYTQKFFYSSDDFLLISKNPTAFKNQLINNFKSQIVDVTAKGCTIKLGNNSALLSCDIIGAMYAPNQYSMHWLLQGTKRFGFDLYGFKQENNTLTYEGMVNGIPTKIILQFSYTLNHCHEHVWPR